MSFCSAKFLQKTADSLKGVPCMWFFVFLLAAFRIFSLAFAFYYYIFLYGSLWIHLVRDSVLSAPGYLFPSPDSGNFQPSFHQIHFDPFLSTHSGTLPIRMLECSMLSQKLLKLFFVLFCFVFGPTMWLWRYLVPRPGIKPRPTAVKALSPNRWTTKEVLLLLSHFSRVRLHNPIDGSPPGSPVPGIPKLS